MLLYTVIPPREIRVTDPRSGSSAGKEFTCNAGHLGSIPGLEDPLEKAMAPHSSTLAWKIPWMEEPGRLQSMGS